MKLNEIKSGEHADPYDALQNDMMRAENAMSNINGFLHKMRKNPSLGEVAILSKIATDLEQVSTNLVTHYKNY